MKAQQLQARRQTEAQAASISRQIIAVYEGVRADILEELERLYARTLSGVKPADYYNVAIQAERLKKFLVQIDVMYAKASIKAGALTAESSALSMQNAYYKNQFVMDFFTPIAGIDLTFTAIPSELVQLSITGNIERWQALELKIRRDIQAKFGKVVEYVPKSGETLSALLLDNRRREIVKINRAITSGLLRGDGYADTASDVKKIIGTVSRKETTGAMASALRIVRTESNRTYNAGAFANTQAVADQDVKIERIWVATLDADTRGLHQSLDGQRVGVDEPFMSGGNEAMYPGGFGIASQDISCRCEVIDAVDGVPPEARLGINQDGDHEVFDWQTYPEWAESQGLTQSKSGKWG